MKQAIGRRSWLIASALFCTTLFSGTLQAEEKVIRLTSLEWPPYSGAAIDQQGASVAVVRAAAEAMGYKLEVKFFPWNRAVAAAEDPKSGYHGYFPEYHSDDVASKFKLSDSIGSGPLGFVESSSAPVSWSSLADLKGKPIGVVDGYVNTTDFDAQVASGELKAEAVSDDLTNIKKVAAGRIALAVIDKNVLGYLLANEASLAAAKDKVQFNSKLLEDKQLFIAFQNSDKGAAAAKVINDGLKKIDVNAVMNKFLTP
ncbi:substrate-binding periplasmic protein [Pseudomarimonas arenosa]|uniref:Transporter substrate-binding domain-containing protein n=1 Tax=Pseudomarimonas arenosa TaxID=2774145 RepID=A0AAW3ZRR1_9GAMM|nr:transporter substrate-binding domain-containing protein [Pseudomarimonas arenosa]MBD8527787.1 transporter substrate-binding domain-containing protein [Pseudomarimonas arenosa]